MSKFVMLIFAAAILSACQTTPKFAPTTVELEGKLISRLKSLVRQMLFAGTCLYQYFFSPAVIQK